MEQEVEQLEEIYDDEPSVQKEEISLKKIVWGWMIAPMLEGFIQTTMLGIAKRIGLKIRSKLFNREL